MYSTFEAVVCLRRPWSSLSRRGHQTISTAALSEQAEGLMFRMSATSSAPRQDEPLLPTWLRRAPILPDERGEVEHGHEAEWSPAPVADQRQPEHGGDQNRCSEFCWDRS